MTSFNGLSIGLSVVFGFFLLALLAEVYYLLRWKKTLISTQVEDENITDSNYAKEIVYLFCGQKRPTLNSREISRANQENSTLHEADIELGCGRNLALSRLTAENVDLELMRLHNLSGPPRFLSTIKEETKDDLESDDGKSRSGRPRRSLNDICDTQSLSPLASPLHDFDSYGFNPLFETSMDVDQYYKLRSSPPPKFKFLRDAEEKLLRKLVIEADMKRASASECEHVQETDEKFNNSTTFTEETEDKSVGTLIANADKDAKSCHNLAKGPSSSSQVLPLAS